MGFDCWEIVFKYIEILGFYRVELILMLLKVIKFFIYFYILWSKKKYLEYGMVN